MREPDLLRGVVINVTDVIAQVTLPRGGSAWVPNEEFHIGQRVFTVVHEGEAVRAIDRTLWNEITRGGSDRDYEDALNKLRKKGFIEDDVDNGGQGEVGYVFQPIVFEWWGE